MSAEPVNKECLRLVLSGNEDVSFMVQPEDLVDSSVPFLQIVTYDIFVDGEREPVGYIVLNVMYRMHLARDSKGLFRTFLDDHSHELNCLAQAIFTKTGMLRQEIVKPLPHWELPWSEKDAKRLGENPMIYIEALVIKEGKWRRRGIGSWAIQNLFATDVVRSLGVDYLMVWPTIPTPFLPYDPAKDPTFEEKVTLAAMHENIIWFYKKLGFRRLGVTEFFMLAKDPNHPSRNLRLEDDLPVVRR